MNQQSIGLILAIATDDEKHFMKRHFGDAKSYLIYQINESGWEFLKKIENNSEEEKRHADPVKAGSISGILKEEGVQVLASKVFGPNIKRMIKKFACILVHEETIELGLDDIKLNYSAILERWKQGPERKPLKV